MQEKQGNVSLTGIRHQTGGRLLPYLYPIIPSKGFLLLNRKLTKLNINRQGSVFFKTYSTTYFHFLAFEFQKLIKWQNANIL